MDKYDDDDDLTVIFSDIFPNAPENMNDFLMAQHKILSAPKNHEKMVWDQSVIKTCLNVWTRSAKSYEDLLDSNILKLPSGGNLRRYKNAVTQESGISDEKFHWMRKTAEKANLPALDEISGSSAAETLWKLCENLKLFLN